MLRRWCVSDHRGVPKCPLVQSVPIYSGSRYTCNELSRYKKEWETLKSDFNKSDPFYAENNIAVTTYKCHRNQWELKVKKSQLPQALENGSSWVAIGFGFTSDWLKRWQVFFSRPITERRQTQCNTAVQSILDWKSLNWIHKITIKPRTIFQHYRFALSLKFNVKRYVYHTCWQCQL